MLCKFRKSIQCDDYWLLDVPVLIHRAGIISPWPGSLTVDSAGVSNVLAASEGAGETVVRPGRVVADTNIGGGPGALVAAGGGTLQTALVDI